MERREPIARVRENVLIAAVAGTMRRG